jgi:hypothetical protein
MDGSPYSGATRTVQFEASDGVACFVGDLVALNSTEGTDTFPTVQQGAASDTAFFGVISSFEFDATDLENKHRLASTQRLAQCVPALDGLFEVQCTVASGIGVLGDTVDIAVGTGSAVTGLSGMELDSTDFGTGLNLHIMGFIDRPDNDIGENNANLVVRINESALRGVGGGV